MPSTLHVRALSRSSRWQFRKCGSHRVSMKTTVVSFRTQEGEPSSSMEWRDFQLREAMQWFCALHFRDLSQAAGHGWPKGCSVKTIHGTLEELNHAAGTSRQILCTSALRHLRWNAAIFNLHQPSRDHGDRSDRPFTSHMLRQMHLLSHSSK